MRIVKNGDVHVSAPIGLPREEVMQFIESHQDWITKARKKTAETEQKRYDFYNQLPLDTPEARQNALKRINQIIKPMVSMHAQEMGVHPSQIVYNATISRWGSCNSKTREVCFSVYLLLLPEWCIEHVVVHELAHLLQPDHSPRFHALMDRYYPRWREARAETLRLASMK